MMAFALLDEETEPQGGSFSLVEDETLDAPGIGTQAVRGVAQGTTDLANLIGLLQAGIQSPLTFALLDPEERREVATPGMRAEAEMLTRPDISPADFSALAMADDDLIGMPQLPGQRALAREKAAEIPESGVLQEVIRRGVRGGPFGPLALAGEYGGLAAKELLKWLGYGEKAQNIADIGVGISTPGSLSKLQRSITGTKKAASIVPKLPAAVEEVGTRVAKAEVIATPKQFQNKIQQLGEEAVEKYGKMTSEKAIPIIEKTPINMRQLENQIIRDTKDATLKSLTRGEEILTDQQAWIKIKDSVIENLNQEREIYRNAYKNAERFSDKILTIPKNSIKQVKNTKNILNKISTKTPGQTTIKSSLKTALNDLGLKKAAPVTTENVVNAVIKKYGLEGSTPERIEEITSVLSKTQKKVPVSNLMALKSRLNGIINYEDLDRSVKDLLRPVIRSLKSDIDNGLNAAPAIKAQWNKAENLFAKTSEKFGKSTVESLRRADVPENVANQFRSGSAAQQLKDVLENSPESWEIVEQQLAKRLANMGTNEANAALRELSPHISENAKNATENLIGMGDKLTEAGAREAARAALFSDIQNMASLGTRPDYALNMMKSPVGYQNVKNLLNKSTKGRKVFNVLKKQFVDDVFESIKNPNGSIDWAKARNVLKNPQVRKVIKESVGEKGLKFFQKMEKYGDNISRNLEMFAKKNPQSVREIIISGTGLFMKSLLSSMVGGKVGLMAYLGIKVVPKVTKGIYYKMLANPRIRDGIQALSNPNNWTPEKIMPTIQKLQAAIASEIPEAQESDKPLPRQRIATRLG